MDYVFEMEFEWVMRLMEIFWNGWKHYGIWIMYYVFEMNVYMNEWIEMNYFLIISFLSFQWICLTS